MEDISYIVNGGKCREDCLLRLFLFWSHGSRLGGTN
jgi:hypothetical protein